MSAAHNEPRRRAWLRTLLLGSATSLVVLAALAAFLIGSERGLRALAALAQRSVPGLQIGAVHGRLYDDCSVDDLQYRDSGVAVHGRRLHLRWHFAALLQRRVHLLRLDVEDLDVDVLDGAAPASPPPATTAAPWPTRLPLDVVVDALELRGFSLREHGRLQTRIESASLRGRWLGEQVEIDALRTALPETGELLLQAQAQFTAEAIVIDALHLRGPGAIDVSGRWGHAATPTALRLHWQDLRWPQQNAQLSQAQGELLLQGRDGQYRYQLDGDARWHARVLRLHGNGQLDAEQSRFETLKLQLGSGRDDDGGAELHGSLRWAPALQADLQATLQHLDPGLFAAGWDGALNGRLELQARQAAQPDLRFKLALQNSKLRGYALALDAQGRSDGRRLQLETAQLRAAQGRVEVRGEVAWAPTLRADLDAQLQHIDPGVFAAAWPGDLNGQLSAHGGGATPVHLVAQLAASQLRGLPLRLRAVADYRPVAEAAEVSQAAEASAVAGAAGRAQIDIATLQLDSGRSQWRLSGRLGPEFDLHTQLDSPNLRQLHPQLDGHLQLEASLQGSAAVPHLRATVSGGDLRYGAYRLGSVSAAADLDPEQPSYLRAEAHDGDVGLRLHNLSVDARGTTVWHEAHIDLDSAAGSAHAALQGGYDRKRREWGGALAALHVLPLRLPSWTLAQPVGMLLGGDRFSIEPACLQADGDAGRACLNVLRQVLQPGLMFGLQLHAVQLAGFQALLPRKTEIAGRVDGGGDLHWLDGDIAAAGIELQLQDVRISAPDTPTLALLPSTLSLSQDRAGNLHAALSLHSAKGGFDAQLHAAPAAQLSTRPLGGSVQVSIPDLAFVHSLIPEVLAPGGMIDGSLNFAGLVGRPRIGGALRLHDGRARLASPNILLEDLQLELAGDGAGPLRLSGRLRSGGGDLQLGGHVDPTQVPLRADLQLDGSQFQALALPSARVWVSPQLRLQGDADGWHLSGELQVPKADITPQALGGDSGVTVSDDQVIVGAAPQDSAGQVLKLSSDVRLTLGDDVHFRGFGLTTRIEGGVAIKETPPREAQGLGELRLIDGRYKAYGQDLQIERGRLIFDGGAVTRPAVDLHALRRPQVDVSVGVRVRGTLDKPELSLESEPAMPREQQLSWLLFGRPLDQNSSADRSFVSSAAVSLGLGGGEALAQTLGRRIGLDQISVGSAPAGGSEVAADASRISGSQAAQSGSPTAAGTNAAQLTLGKYLTPRLFLSYGVSLFQPGQTFRLLYDLGHGFKVQTESGVASGGDVLYTVERGK